MKYLGQSNHALQSKISANQTALCGAIACTLQHKAQVVEKDLLDNALSINPKAEVATITMVQTILLEEQIESLTTAVGNLLKHVQAHNDQFNKLHDKFQSTPASNEFEVQDFSVECNTSKGILVSTNEFVSTENIKNIVNEVIENVYEPRVQVFKSYVKPYTKTIEQLRMPKNYQPPKFRQFSGHGDPRQHIAHFVETCNNAGTDGDLLVKQIVLSLKDAAFDWYIDLEANSVDSW
ncbi:UNVERIFIED_CONTAM: hypothetical protein Slati_1117000 [Sesamum latifolium]|uniref:Ty3-gypsy retrotransposon protein n=1 Tax=Sesamum latifolium TaxID=2727402 RepID=A0AAW2XC72_9LAMI